MNHKYLSKNITSKQLSIMTKNEIIKDYKDFFDLHAKGIALDEDDHLILDWAEELVKKVAEQFKY